MIDTGDYNDNGAWSVTPRFCAFALITLILFMPVVAPIMAVIPSQRNKLMDIVKHFPHMYRYAFKGKGDYIP